MIAIFWGLFIILVIASAIAIYNLIREEKLYDKREAEQKVRFHRLEQALDTKEKDVEKLNKQIVELKDKIFQSQDTLKHELNKKDRETEKLLTQLKNDFSDKEKKLNAHILELKNQLLQSQDALKKEVLNKSNLEKKLSELEAQLVKLNKDLSSNIEMYSGLKGQYDDLEREMEQLQQELVNKETVLKREQAAHQEIKEKYETLLQSTNSPKVEKKDDAV